MPIYERKDSEHFKSREVVIKIGSSTITGGGAEVDTNFLGSIARQLAELRANGVNTTIVTSGAVACGIRFVPEYDKNCQRHKQMAAAFGQPIIMTKWQNAFDPFGIQVAQILLTQETLGIAGQLIREISKYGVPIINANDSVSSVELDQLNVCADNDRLAGHLARAIHADTVLLLSDTAVRDVDGRAVSHISPQDDWQRRISFRGVSSVGTGGMASKHHEALRLASSGIRAHVGNGRDHDAILNAAKGLPFGTTYQL